MTVHMIRHGKTIANEQKLYCGKTDLSLSQEGLLVLKHLQSQNIYPTSDLIFSSGLKRTNETIAIIYGNVSYKVIPDLAEMDFGDFEMKSYEQLKNRLDYQNWIQNIDDVKCSNGESRNIFLARVLKGLEEAISVVKKLNLESCILVTHGGVIAEIMEYHFPATRNFYEWQPKCGSGYSLVLDEAKYLFEEI